MYFFVFVKVIVEELEEGEIIENDHAKTKTEVHRQIGKIATPKIKTRRSNGEELEDGELVTSEEETPSPIAKKFDKKTTQSNPNSTITNNKDKRGMENKENRADKKKKGKFVCLVYFYVNEIG